MHLVNLFSRLPDNAFSPLSNRNKTVYVEAFYFVFEQMRTSVKASFDDVVEMVERRLKEENLRIIINDGTSEERREDLHKSVLDIVNTLSRKDIGWFHKEEFDRDTFEKSIMINTTGNFIHMLIDESFKDLLNEPWTVDINIIDAIITTDENWEKYPYRSGLEPAIEQTSKLSNNLKILNGIIDKSMAQMFNDKSLDEALQTMRDFADGKFMPLFRELKEQLNQTRRDRVLSQLQERFNNPDTYRRMLAEYMENNFVQEEETARDDLRRAKESIERSFRYDYLETIEHIQAKISRYLMIMYYKVKYFSTHGVNMQEILLQIIGQIKADKSFASAELTSPAPERYTDLIQLRRFNYVTEDSLYIPRMPRKIRVTEPLGEEQLTEDQLQAEREQLERDCNDPFAEEKIRSFTEALMDGRESLNLDEEIEIRSDNDAIIILLTLLYAKDNGYEPETISGEWVRIGDTLMEKARIRRQKGEAQHE